MLNKKSVDDINVKGKKVLVRCDFNVPLQDGKMLSYLRTHVIAQKKQRTETNSAKNLLLFVMYLLMMHLVQLTEHTALMLV